MEDHYALWQESMLAHFGHKWLALNRGPMWQYDEFIESVEANEIQPAETGVELNSVVPESACNVATCSMPKTTEDIISTALVESGLSVDSVSSEANMERVNSNSENILSKALSLSDVDIRCFFPVPSHKIQRLIFLKTQWFQQFVALKDAV